MINHGLHGLKPRIIPMVAFLRNFPSGSRRDIKTFTTFGTRIIILASCYLLLATFCFAQSIASTELINNAQQYDSKTVVYEGEVIGEVMKRGDYSWMNVNDGENAIGIWINTSLVKEIIYTGSYKVKGDRAQITGLFNRACPQHGGDLDIHALALRKINSGKLLLEELNIDKRNQVLVLTGLLCLVLILRQLKRV